MQFPDIPSLLCSQHLSESLTLQPQPCFDRSSSALAAPWQMPHALSPPPRPPAWKTHRAQVVFRSELALQTRYPAYLANRDSRDTFSKREKANEDLYVREQEMAK